MRASIALLACVSGALAASPVPGFRAPAVPLIESSPLINVFSTTDGLAQSSPSQWTGASLDMFSGVTVDGQFYLLCVHRTPHTLPRTRGWLRVGDLSVWLDSCSGVAACARGKSRPRKASRV
jgi:hypothetical protein